MNLPPPRAKLCGAIWFARIREKARLLKQDELAPEYAARFCHPTGCDIQFMTYFGLGREALVDIAVLDDASVSAWFLKQPGVSPERIASWNQISVNMGRPGYPMADRLPIAKSTTYSHIPSAHIETVYELLEADESVVVPPSERSPSE